MLLEYALWANETAVCACVLLILGGLWNAICQTPRWGIGLYCLIGGLVFLLLEYPRSKRQHGRGNTPSRSGQALLERLLSKVLKLEMSYLLRFISMLLFSFAGILNIETLCGAATMAYSAVLYFVAALKHEAWRSPSAACEPAARGGIENDAFEAPPPPPSESNRI